MGEHVKAIHSHFKASPQNKRFMGPCRYWNPLQLAAIRWVQKSKVTFGKGSGIILKLPGLNSGLYHGLLIKPQLGVPS